METNLFLPSLPLCARVALGLLCLLDEALAIEPCRIEVVEKGSGWPVPLVELRTTHQVRLVSDNAGVIACEEPDLLGRETWFEVIGHGYGVPADGFGLRGVRLTPRPGATLRLEVERRNIARRLGRLTGAGLFAESQKLGQELEWQEQGITGCDSVLLASHRGKLFWAWGDTLVPHYALGLYQTTSATTTPTPLATLEPPLRLRFDYFTDDRERVRNVATMPGPGPTWLTGYVSLPDHAGEPHLVATYTKIRGHLEAYETGLCAWNEATSNFEQARVLWRKSEGGPPRPAMPEGHAAFWKEADGRAFVYFGNPFPTLRCAATYEAWQDAETWEKLPPPTPPRAADGGKAVQPHTGSIAWNAFRQRWVTVFLEKFGQPSSLGELWYAEAPSPTGPWGAAVKVLTHDNYTFYNPLLHPELTPAGSPILLFEGTYTAEFANHPQSTPRFNYNQILYRLDLDDPKLAGAH